MQRTIIFFPIIIFLTLTQSAFAQYSFLEGGIGIGNVVGSEHSLGKAEAHITILRTFQFGVLGLDLSTGGNFIPGSNSIEEPGMEVLSSNDTRFNSIMLLYRLPLYKSVFIEPRFGYASLNSLVHTMDRRKIKQDNFSTGVGIGKTLKEITLSLRYQYYGKTASYDGRTVKSYAEPVSMILLSMSYGFKLNKSREK